MFMTFPLWLWKGRGLREPCLAVLWEGAHLQACWGAPAFSCGASVKQICTIVLMTHILWCSFPHSPYTSMDCYFLLLFLFSIYCPKFKSAVVSLCCFLSVTRLFNFPLPWFLICLNGCCYCSLSNWTIYQVLPQQSVFCLFINWFLLFEAVDICKETLLQDSTSPILHSSELPHPLLSLLPYFHTSSSNVSGSERTAPAALGSWFLFFYFFILFI